MKVGNLRGALIGVLAATAACVFPGVAAATITPKLTVGLPGGAAAGTSVTIGFHTSFQPSGGDGAKDVTYAFPAGLWPNLNLDGGHCITATAPTAACQLGNGLVNATAFTAYLVRPRSSSDVAGVELQGNSLAITGDLSLRRPPQPPGLDLTFDALPASPAIAELDLRLTALRLPTSCPKPSAAVGLTADPQQGGSSRTASAPLIVTGCHALPFAPKASVSVFKHGAQATVTTDVTESAGQSGLKSASIFIPTGVKVQKVLGSCLEGTPCVIGTGSLTSPLLPASAFGRGTLVLGGSIFKTITLTVTFPGPYAFVLNGTVNLHTRALVFSNVPDIPLSSFALTITGPNGNSVFVATCQPGTLKTILTPQDGNAAIAVGGPVISHGCPPPRVGKPTASGSLTGLTTGQPQLRLTVVHGSNAPDIASVSVSLPAGLSFHAHASGKSLKGLSVSGGSVAAAKLRGEALVISFKAATGNASLAAAGPLLTEAKALQTKAKKHTLHKLSATVKVTNAKGKITAIALAL